MNVNSYIPLSKEMHKSLDADTSLITQDDPHHSVYEGTHINRNYSFKPQLKNKINTLDIIYFAKDHRLFTLVPVLTIPKENEGKKPFFTTGSIHRYRGHTWIGDNNTIVDPFDKQIRNSNMAIVIQDEMLVIDIDNTTKQDGQNGVTYFTQLVTQNTTYSTIEEYCAGERVNYTKTPSDGYHLYYEFKPSYHQEVSPTFSMCKAIDVKRPGEFVTAPGSVYQGCHPLHTYDKQAKTYTKDENTTPHKCGGSNKDCKYKGKIYTPHFQPVPNPRLGLPEPEPYYKQLPIWIQKECIRDTSHIQHTPYVPEVKMDINHPKLKGLLECCKPAFLADMNTWLSAIWLFKTILGEDGRALVHEYSREYATYSQSETDKLFDSDKTTNYPFKLLHKLAKTFSPEAYAKITNPIHVNLTFTPDKIINTEYTSSNVYLQTSEVVAYQSNMCTGKTHCIPEVIQTLEQQYNRSIRVLVVLFRVTLVTELVNKWKHLGFTSYQECDKYIHSSKYPRMIVQIDSLHKVTGKFDLLILDEIESTVNHITSGHIKHFEPSYRNFITYCKKTPKVFCMDATLQDITVDTLFKNSSVIKIKNTYQSYKKANVGFTHCKAHFIQMCISDLQQGKKIIIPSNSERFIVYLREVVHKTLPELRVGIKTAELGLDITTDDWDKYDLFMYSPTIIAGVSFDKPHFDKCYAYFTDRSCTGDLCAQQLIRARILKDNQYVIFTPKASDETSLSVTREQAEDYIIDIIKEGDNHLYTDGIVVDCHEEQIEKNEYYYLLLSSIIKRNLTAVNLYGYLKTLLEMHGMKCTNITIPIKNEEVVDSIIQLGTLFEESAKKVNKDKANEIINSRLLSKEEYEEVTRKPSNLITKEEKNSIIKTLFIQTYEEPDVTSGLLLKRLPYMNGFRTIKPIRVGKTIDECIEYARNKHEETYNARLEAITMQEIEKSKHQHISTFDVPSEDESKFSVKSDGEEEEPLKTVEDDDILQKEEEEEEEDNQERIKSFLDKQIERKDAIRKKVFKGKTTESSKYKMEYSKKWKKLEYALKIIKVCGFNALNDIEERKVDWEKVEDFIIEHEKSIRALWNIEKYKQVEPDEREDDEEEGIRKINKISLVKYIQNRIERTTGLTIKATSNGSKNYNLRLK
jgi:hypothetical protein